MLGVDIGKALDEILDGGLLGRALLLVRIALVLRVDALRLRHVSLVEGRTGQRLKLGEAGLVGLGHVRGQRHALVLAELGERGVESIMIADELSRVGFHVLAARLLGRELGCRELVGRALRILGEERRVGLARFRRGGTRERGERERDGHHEGRQDTGFHCTSPELFVERTPSDHGSKTYAGAGSRRPARRRPLHEVRRAGDATRRRNLVAQGRGVTTEAVLRDKPGERAFHSRDGQPPRSDHEARPATRDAGPDRALLEGERYDEERNARRQRVERGVQTTMGHGDGRVPQHGTLRHEALGPDAAGERRGLPIGELAPMGGEEAQVEPRAGLGDSPEDRQAPALQGPQGAKDEGASLVVPRADLGTAQRPHVRERRRRITAGPIEPPHRLADLERGRQAVLDRVEGPKRPARRVASDHAPDGRHQPVRDAVAADIAPHGRVILPIGPVDEGRRHAIQKNAEPLPVAAKINPASISAGGLRFAAPPTPKKPEIISADDAFKLHDTYGFPIDLTRIMAEERGMSVDIAGYEKLMEQAKDLARSGGKGEASKLIDLPPAALAQLAETGVKPTDDKYKFLKDPVQAKVMAIWNGDDLGLSPARAFEDEQLAIILDKTNFYAEMGGQVGDTGTLSSGLVASATMQFTVETTKISARYILHMGRLKSGKIQVGDSITATVSDARAKNGKEPQHHPPRQLGPAGNSR